MEKNIKYRNRIINRRILLFIFSVFFLMSELFQFRASGEINIPESMYSKGFAIIDADNGRLLYGKNEETKYPMASTTKIMTCILAVEYGNPDDIVEVSSYAASMPDVQLNIKTGEQYRLGDLLYSLMLESHNDVAVAIAEHIGGSVEKFAELMNQKARDLGCMNTYYITPNGLDAEKTSSDGNILVHSTTAYDLAVIMSYCINNEEFCKITTTATYSFSEINGKSKHSVSNKNSLLTMVDGVISGKTGYTGNAGYCYVCAVERAGKRFAISLLGAGWPPNKNYKWSDVKKLIKYGESNYYNKVVYEPENYIKEIEVENGITEKIWTYTDGKVALNISEDEEVDINYILNEKTVAPVAKGEVVGLVEIYVDKCLYSVVPIKALESSEKRNFEYWFDIVLGCFLP